MSEHHPLIVIDSDNCTRRLEHRSCDPEHPTITRLRCPLSRDFCSYACAFFGLHEGIGGAPWAICRQAKTVIGVFDLETVDADKIGNLRYGTDLQVQLKNGKR